MADFGEADFGTLINIAGKQRMLSHRFALFASLAREAASAGERERAVVDMLQSTLTELESNHHTILNGSVQLGIPSGISPSLDMLLNSSGSPILGNVERFLELAGSIAARVTSGEETDPADVIDLALFVSGPLLESLNSIIAAVNQDLASSAQRQAQKMEDGRTLLLSTLARINKTGATIRMISFNATIEAARAGATGRSFAVIAKEIQSLSVETQATAAKMEAQLNELFGG